MWPFAHLAIGYVLYSSYTHTRFRQAPEGTATLSLAFGTQLPDLIDKPLIWIGVFPPGRWIGHSLLVALPIIVIGGPIIYYWLNVSNPIVAFSIGYIAHPISDAFEYFLQGSLAKDFYEVSFLVWPLLLPGNAIVEAISINTTIENLVLYKETWTAQNLPPAHGELQIWLRLFEVGITLLAMGLWLYDEKPGWNQVREALTRIQM